MAACKKGESVSPSLKTSAVVDDGSSTVRAGLKMGSTPPCGRFMDLTGLAEVEAVIDLLDACQSDDDVKLRVSLFNSRRAAIMDLVTKARAASTEPQQKKKISPCIIPL